MRKYTLAQLTEICAKNNWVLTQCDDEPKFELTTYQVSEQEVSEYFGEFRNTDKDKDNYFFNFYTE